MQKFRMFFIMGAKIEKNPLQTTSDKKDYL